MRQWNLRLIDPLIQSSEFARRRRRLLDGMRPGSIAIVPGAVEQRRNRDITLFVKTAISTISPVFVSRMRCWC